MNSSIMLSSQRRAHKSTFGKHGLDVAPAVIREDEGFCTSRSPHGSLLQLCEFEHIGVNHCAIRLNDKFLGDLIGLQHRQ